MGGGRRSGPHLKYRKDVGIFTKLFQIPDHLQSYQVIIQCLAIIDTQLEGRLLVVACRHSHSSLAKNVFLIIFVLEKYGLVRFERLFAFHNALNYICCPGNLKKVLVSTVKGRAKLL